jgi:hypothetical protein
MAATTITKDTTKATKAWNKKLAKICNKALNFIKSPEIRTNPDGIEYAVDFATGLPISGALFARLPHCPDAIETNVSPNEQQVLSEFHGCFEDPHTAWLGFVSCVQLLFKDEKFIEKMKAEGIEESDVLDHYNSFLANFLPLAVRKERTVGLKDLGHFGGTYGIDTWNNARMTTFPLLKHWLGSCLFEHDILSCSIHEYQTKEIKDKEQAKLKRLSKGQSSSSSSSASPSWCANCKAPLTRDNILKKEPEPEQQTPVTLYSQFSPPPQPQSNGSKGKRKAVEQGGPPKKERSVQASGNGN